MSETVHIGGLIFEVRRSVRRTTLGLTVDRSGELVVHCPESASDDMVTRWTSSKLLWVHGKLALKEKFAPKLRGPEFVTGESFCYLGRRYQLRVDRTQKDPLRFDGKQFLLRPDARPPSEHFRDWYTRTGTPWIIERVAFLAARTGQRPSRVEVRDLGFRWGSCGKHGILFFNWKTLQLPVRLVDYVIVHELTHLKQRHHTKAFWAAIESAMPDWRERQEELQRRAQEFLLFGVDGGAASTRL